MDEKTTGRTVDLPASRAFVVQLAASVGAETPIRGRIEHLASGSVTHFESLTQLGDFIVRVLAPASAADPRDRAAPAVQLTEQAGSQREDSTSTRRRHSRGGTHSPRWVHRGRKG